MKKAGDGERDRELLALLQYCDCCKQEEKEIKEQSVKQRKRRRVGSCCQLICPWFGPRQIIFQARSEVLAALDRFDDVEHVTDIYDYLREVCPPPPPPARSALRVKSQTRKGKS
eukprot:1243064-Rhodomonas_salina.2